MRSMGEPFHDGMLNADQNQTKIFFILGSHKKLSSMNLFLKIVFPLSIKKRKIQTQTDDYFH